jgi:hypothetical protein
MAPSVGALLYLDIELLAQEVLNINNPLLITDMIVVSCHNGGSM